MAIDHVDGGEFGVMHRRHGDISMQGRLAELKPLRRVKQNVEAQSLKAQSLG